MPNLPEGSATLVTKAIPAIGAGLFLVYNVQDHVRLLPISIRVTLVTSAAVAPRQLYIEMQPGVIIGVVVPTAQIQTASLTYTYYFTVGWNLPTYMSSPMRIINNLPYPIILNGGDAIYIGAENLDAADQLQGGLINTMEWIEP